MTSSSFLYDINHQTLKAHSSTTSQQVTGGNQVNGQQEKSSSFNPATHHFSPEELKPTPIQRKSRKTLVRAEDKDDKYWDKVWIELKKQLFYFKK